MDEQDPQIEGQTLGTDVEQPEPATTEAENLPVDAGIPTLVDFQRDVLRQTLQNSRQQAAVASVMFELASNVGVDGTHPTQAKDELVRHLRAIPVCESLLEQLEASNEFIVSPRIVAELSKLESPLAIPGLLVAQGNTAVRELR